MSPVEEDKVWLITGCSSGMGRDIAFEALLCGYRVVTTTVPEDITPRNRLLIGWPRPE